MPKGETLPLAWSDAQRRAEGRDEVQEERWREEDQSGLGGRTNVKGERRQPRRGRARQQKGQRRDGRGEPRQTRGRAGGFRPSTSRALLILSDCFRDARASVLPLQCTSHNGHTTRNPHSHRQLSASINHRFLAPPFSPSRTPAPNTHLVRVIRFEPLCRRNNGALITRVHRAQVCRRIAAAAAAAAARCSRPGCALLSTAAHNAHVFAVAVAMRIRRAC
eukprot:364735-Chlamydomonas_euryale.AAC.13